MNGQIDQEQGVLQRIAWRIFIAVSFIVGVSLLGIALSIMFKNWWFIQTLPWVGVVLCAAGVIYLSWHDFTMIAEIKWHIDLNGDKVIGVPTKSVSETAESASVIEFEKRMHRALELVTDKGIKPTRAALCAEHKIMSQTEWAKWRDWCIKSGVLAPNSKVMAVTYADARAKWEEKLNPRQMVNIGGKGNAAIMVRVSGLWGEQ